MLDEASIRVRQGLGLAIVGVGIAGGAIGAAYVGALHVLGRVIGPEHHAAGIQLLIFIAVGGLVALITRLWGETGNVELLVDNIHVMGGADDVRSLRPLIPTSLLCVASGAGMGPEAPLVQTTGAFGTLLGSRRGHSTTDVRVLTITGMAAGFTVLFGAPLGSALFALEILHRRGLQYYEALLPAVVGSLCGYGVYLGLSGLGVSSIWNFPPVGDLAVHDLALAAGIGLIGAAGAAIFTGATHLGRKAFGMVPVSARYILGGLALGLLGWWSPYALTFGEVQLSELLDVRIGVGALAVAMAAKLLGTTVTLAAGWKGGFIIPLFFLGVACGEIVHLVAPSANEAVVVAALMVALCVGVTKTPLGSTLVVTEMAGLVLLPTTLVAAVVALVLSGRHGLIDSQRDRRPVERPAMEIGG